MKNIEITPRGDDVKRLSETIDLVVDHDFENQALISYLTYLYNEFIDKTDQESIREVLESEL